MDLSGSTFGLGLFSMAQFDGGDAGAGVFQLMRSGVENALQHHMNVAVSATPDARDVIRSWLSRVKETTYKAEAEVIQFLQQDEELGTEATVGTERAGSLPCLERHRDFLRGLDTPGFITSRTWLSRNLRSVVDHDAMLSDIHSALGMGVSALQEKIKCLMDMYLPTLETMDAAYKRLQTKLKQIEAFSKQVTSLRLPDIEPTPEMATLQTALLAHIESQYTALRIEDDYIEFCDQYERFQTYRSVLCLLRPFDALLTQGSGASHGPMCSVCMTEPVAAAVVPCGHTFCTKCCSSQYRMCYICRTPVKDKQRLYFG